MRLLRVGLGVLALLFGVMCLNYTTGAGVEHHREWAAAHGFPEPAYSIFLVGAVVTALAAGFLGFLIGSKKRG